MTVDFQRIASHPFFLAVLLIHIPCGIVAVITGLIAMLSKKQPGRHPNFGTIYYWALVVVCVSATILAFRRWSAHAYLFFLGVVAFTAATLGRTAERRRWLGWVRLHITGMGLSYLVLVTAFLVDNGESLPLWKELPRIAYWLIPSAIGLPLILRAYFWHPLVRQPEQALQSVSN